MNPRQAERLEAIATSAVVTLARIAERLGIDDLNDDEAIVDTDVRRVRTALTEAYTAGWDASRREILKVLER